MKITPRTFVMVSAAVLVAVAGVRAQDPPRGRGAGGRGAGPAAPAPPPGVVPIPGRPPVDMAAHDRGRAIWAAQCIDCHGTVARGGEKGPNIIRTITVNYDRSSATPGSVLGPFLKKGHPTQSGKASATFTEEEIVGLAQFLRQKVNDTMRSSPLFTVGDIVVGDSKAGESYFSGEGRCSTCHNASTRNLAGIKTRIPVPVDLQQRMLFPGGFRGRGAAPAGPNPNAITVTITPASGPAMSGVLVEQSDFYVTFRQADGTLKVVPRAGARVALTNPLQAHIDLLDRITDKQIHDVVAYLETLK
jgi:cytochrome c oxidase cbb3-type subunit 3